MNRYENNTNQERIRRDEHVARRASRGELGLELRGDLLTAGLEPVNGEPGHRLFELRLEGVEHMTVHRRVDPHFARRGRVARRRRRAR